MKELEPDHTIWKTAYAQAYSLLVISVEKDEAGEMVDLILGLKYSLPTAAFACLPNHVTGKAWLSASSYDEDANMLAMGDPGASHEIS